MEYQSLQKKEDRSWVRKSAVGVVALLLVVGVIGAVAVNKAKLDEAMEVDVFNPDSAMGDVVKPLVTGDVAKADETVYEEPDDDQEYVLDDEVPKTEDDDVETVLADDTMKDGDKYDDEVAEMDVDDDDAMKNFKAGKDIAATEDSRYRCRPRCRYVRRCYRVRAGDRNNDDRDDFRRVCRRRRICRCPRGYRRVCRRRCRRRCFRRRYRVCRWRRYRRCRRYRRRVKKSSDDYAWRYFTRCRNYRRRVCGWRYRRYCRNYCRRYGCRRVCRRCRGSKSA